MAKYKNSTKEDPIKAATKRLEKGITDFMSSDKFREYLKVMSRFHTYGYSNSILIAMQKPDATLLAGFSTWKNKFERYPKRGSHGIKIFAPNHSKTQKYKTREKIDPRTNLPVLDQDGNPVIEQIPVKIPSFHIVTVFDVSDTDGKPLPELDIPPLVGDVTQYDTLMEAIRRTANVPVSIGPVNGDANGYFDQEKIVIRDGLSELQTVKTAIHELVHSRYHNIAETAQKNFHKNQATREVEAESIAFVVCEHFGLDTADYSFGYVSSWSSNKELPELKSSLQVIHDGALQIINELELHLNEIQKEHEAPSLEDPVRATTKENYLQRIKISNIPHPEEYAELFDKLYDSGELDSLKPTVEQNPLRDLANALHDFSRQYDPNLFPENSNHESASFEEKILAQMETGNVSALKEWLRSIVLEDSAFSKQAEKLFERLNTQFPDPVPPGLEKYASITTEEPSETVFKIGSMYLHIQDASDGSWDYTVYDSRLQAIDGGQIGDPSMKLASALYDIIQGQGLSKTAIPEEISLDAFEQLCQEQEERLHCPVCHMTFSEALENDSVKAWKESHLANISCADQFDNEYGARYHARDVPAFLKEMTNRYGLERCMLVLASTIQLSPWDNRYHKPVREGAEKIPVPGASDVPTEDRRRDYLVKCHPVMVDVAFRDLMAMEQQIQESRKSAKEESVQMETSASKDKPSVLGKLKAKQQEIAASLPPGKPGVHEKEPLKK